ncbi:dienelactone hydrolase family protein [Luteimonas sp. e5]
MQRIDLDTPAGRVQAWHAVPAGTPRGAVIVVQEIFGANAHVRSLIERLAADGWEALAPSMFDPVTPDAAGIELDYDDAGMARGRELAAELGFAAAVQIIDAAQQWLEGRGRKVAVMGFCWGGSVALLGNLRLGLPAIGWYGARSMPFLNEPLRAPLLLHFGEEDPLIPAEDIERQRAAWPEAGVHVYQGAGHAFNRDCDGEHFRPGAAALAWSRSLEFLEQHLETSA